MDGMQLPCKTSKAKTPKDFSFGVEASNNFEEAEYFLCLFPTTAVR
jgi:hypothetical protein